MYKIYVNVKVVFINYCLYMVLVVYNIRKLVMWGFLIYINLMVVFWLDRVRLRMYVLVVLVLEFNLFFSLVIIEVWRC